MTIGVLAVCYSGLMITKQWGHSQVYPEYHHPLLVNTKPPLIFIKAPFEKTAENIRTNHDIYLDVTMTADQKLVVPLHEWSVHDKPVHIFNYADIKDQVILLEDFKDLLKNKNIFFNLYDNLQAEHEIFLYNMKQLGLEKGENFIIGSPYEAPIRELKNLAPALLFASTQPEILKMVAMQSMFILEAANIRADFIVHTLKLHGRDFFNEDILKEVARRNKHIIVGPIEEGEKDEALKLHPFGLIVNEH